MKPSAVACPAFFHDDQYCPLCRLDCPNARPQVTRATAKYRHEMPVQYVTMPTNMLWGFKTSVPEDLQAGAATNRLDLKNYLTNSYQPFYVASPLKWFEMVQVLVACARSFPQNKRLCPGNLHHPFFLAPR